MLDRTMTEADAEIRAAAESYCRALHATDVAMLERLFHEVSNLYLAQTDGTLVAWPRQQFLDRVGSREPGAGEASFEIESVDIAGPEMACVRLTVQVGPRRFRDYLNFLKVGGEWRVVAKLFRVVDGPAV